jgi:hypothetical protein
LCAVEAAEAGLPNRERSSSPEVQFLYSQPKPLVHEVYGANVQFGANGVIEGPQSCNWCAEARYGLHGPPQQATTEDSKGLGNVQEATAASMPAAKCAMCCNCTWARLAVLLCDKHRFVAVDDAPTRDFTVQHIDSLLYNNLLSQNFWKWCAVCRKPARHQCGTAGAVDVLSLDGASDGCGLCLCGECHAGVTVNFGGNVSHYIANREMAGDQELRADANFLRMDGFLMQVLHRMQA